jgi:hypothetical protein
MAVESRLEPPSTGGPSDPTVPVVVSVHLLARELEELIAALDRRLPRVEQAGEMSIARDAAALRAKAVDRLATLHREAAALVTDSAGPLR